MTTPQASAEELAAWGLTPDDVKDQDVIEVWPENAKTVDIYMALRTQWVYADFGPVGMNYTAIPAVMKMFGVPKKERMTVFEGLRVMEVTELSYIRQQDLRNLRGKKHG